MPRTDEPDRAMPDELTEAYGLLREFWETVENSMEGDHPAKARLDGWLSRYEAGTCFRCGE